MNNFTDISDKLTLCADKVEKALNSFYPETSDTDIALCRNAEKYSLLAGGKRIRPFLVCEFSRLFGGNEDAALSFACAVEMMHTFSLIHDDLPCMDNDDLRRGRPTSHKTFGEATALLAGDSLSIRAFDVIAASVACDKEKIRAVSALAYAAGCDGMIGGQLTDMRGETEKFDFETLQKLHSLKTGAMIVCSAKLGCISANVEDNSEKMRNSIDYAKRIGLVFQIIDDILDVKSTAKELGKSVGSDAQNNKNTFLSFMSCEDAFKYAFKLTEEAKTFIAGYEGADTLTGLADMLLYRKK